MALEQALITIEKEPKNAATPLNVLAAQVTPNELFYVRNHFATPKLSADRWRLRLEGLVERPTELSLPDLQSFGQKSITMLMECAGNARDQLDPAPPGTPWNHGAVSVARFKGVPLRTLLELVQLEDQAVEIFFEGADGGEVEPGRQVKYGRSLPLEQALDENTILAWEMNGEPLPVDHGYPLRLVVPGWYGMASVKWLTRIEAIAEPYQGYFQHERYVYKDDLEQGSGPPVTKMKVRALITSPADGDEVDGKLIEIKGLAWSGMGAIESVELSFDEGASWVAVDYQPGATEYVPGHWAYSWIPEKAGPHTMMCRAQDSSGQQQPSTYPWNALGYGNNGPHAIRVKIAEG